MLAKTCSIPTLFPKNKYFFDDWICDSLDRPSLIVIVDFHHSCFNYLGNVYSINTIIRSFCKYYKNFFAPCQNSNLTNFISRLMLIWNYRSHILQLRWQFGKHRNLYNLMGYISSFLFLFSQIPYYVIPAGQLSFNNLLILSSVINIVQF